MQITLVILIVALIARNSLYLGVYSEIFRAFALILCAISGLFGVLQFNVIKLLKRYWPIWGYVFIFLCSIVETRDVIFVLFQSISTLAILLFSIAYYEKNNNRLQAANDLLFKWMFFLYFIVCSVSIMLAIISSGYVYETLYGGEVRFKGVFVKAGMMGATAGVLIGAFWLNTKQKTIKYLAVIAGLVCVGLTLSRTFWVASIVSFFFTGIVYKPKFRKMLLGGGLVLIFVYFLSTSFKITVETKNIESIVRINSISSLSGRLALWEAGIKAAAKKPLLGNGLTAGSLALEKKGFTSLSGSSLEKSRERGQRTFHSGYIQSLLDTGIMGTFFYLMILIRSVFCIFKYDVNREYPVAFYCIIFLIIANISENIIYAASVFNSILFWILAAFSMSLSRAKKIQTIKGTN